jgi:hypothetical protein
MVQEAQTLDVFAASMRTYLQSDEKRLQRNGLI